MEWQEILGYVASVVVAVSLMMSSIVKLRWINLIGATLFSIYGFIIGALPVGFLNGFIAIINVYYLIKMYNRTEYFKVLESSAGSKYQIEFINYYKEEIKNFFPDYAFNPNIIDHSFLILRNMAIAGIVQARKIDENKLFIELDFVIREFRDLKPGLFLFQQNKNVFKQHGFSEINAQATTKEHANYLRKIGFTTKNNKDFVFYL